MKKVFKLFCYVILGMQSQNNKLFIAPLLPTLYKVLSSGNNSLQMHPTFPNGFEEVGFERQAHPDM